MAKVAISDGHEMTTAGKRTPPIPELNWRVIHENEFNKTVALLLEKELLRCGFDVVNVSSTNNDSLEDRVNRANAEDADIFVAIHYNAYDGVFDDYDPEGISVRIYAKGGNAEKLANAVHKYLIQGTTQKDRGVVVNNFYVLRNTKMPAILTENGFMDNKREAMLMLDKLFQKEVAIEHAKGICDYFDVPYIKEELVNKHKIIGEVTATFEQAQAWARSKGASEEFIGLAPIFWQIAKDAVINPVGVYAQSAKETAFGNFGGVLDNTYCNPCGMKTTQGGGNYDPAAHQKFSNWREGINAQVDHLALYAGVLGYPRANTPDPRHFDFIKGTAHYWEDLGGKWAPSSTYGENIVTMMGQIEKMVVPETPEEPVENVSEWAKEAWLKAKNMGLNDGVGAKNPVTEEQLMVFFDKLGLLK